MSNGYRTLSQHLNDLKKENFSLKLRIYFLEERMQQKYEASREDIYKRVSAGGAATPLGWLGGQCGHIKMLSCSYVPLCTVRSSEGGGSGPALVTFTPRDLGQAHFAPFTSYSPAL